MIKNILISFTSLIAIIAVIIALFVMQERNFYGKPVELPLTQHASTGSGFTYTRHFFTVDATGKLFGRNLNPLSIAQFKEELTKNDCKDVALRVDHKCKFENLKPILSTLYESEVLFVCFRVED